MNYPFAQQCSSTFTDIYQRGLWGNGSGKGSEASRCGPFLSFFRHFYRRAVVLDIGCGDLRLWQTSSGEIELPGSSYIGVDVVEDLISRHRDLAGERMWRANFIHASLDSAQILAIGRVADVVLVKDVFQHLPLNDIMRAITVLLRWNEEGSDIVLSHEYDPTFPGSNKDIELGGCRPLDFTAAPFCFTPHHQFYWELADDPDHRRKQVIVI